MFGTQLQEIQDIQLFENKLKLDEIKNEEDYEFFRDLVNKLKIIQEKFSIDWKNYTHITKKQYDKHYKTLQKLKYNYKKFNPGTKILYFCGDKPVSHSKKWVQRWNGPFTIVKRLNDRSVVIMDDIDGASRRVSVDRIKVFENDKHYQIDEYVRLMTNRVFNQ